MINVPVSYIFNALDKENGIKLMRALSGCRVYFAVNAIRNYLIQEDYKTIQGTHKQKIKQLSSSYEIKESRIKEILKRNNELIEN